MESKTIQKRKYNREVSLSVIGFGGIVVVGQEQPNANQIVADAIKKGVNYFDVAPSYFDGEAEMKLGIALEPYRHKVFLACKTTERDAEGAQRELEQSFKRLRTDYFDLYQFHAVTTLDDVEKIWAPGGAAEVFLRARDQRKVKYIGFSAHTEEAALEMMDRFEFDSVLFPLNYVCFAQGNFGPKVVQRAQEKGVALLALKSMAFTKKSEDAKMEYPNCWYQPIKDKELARQALRFTLSTGVTALIPPGENQLFQMALNLAPNLNEPLSPEERQQLFDSSNGVEPIF